MRAHESPTARTAAALLYAVAALTGCTGARPEEDRCAEVNAEVAACLGSDGLRLDCTLASGADVEGLAALVEGASCAELVDLVPIDGDPASALCKVLGVGCVAAVTPQPVRAPTAHPIVLVNGIDTSPLFRYDARIVATMRDRGGHDVHLAVLPPYQPPHRRAAVLWERIEAVRVATGADKVNLVCHSLGGLDCRYLVSPGGLHWDIPEGHAKLAGAVASVTTVGTAHRGTRIADVLLDLAPDDGDHAEALEDFATLVGDWFSEEALADDANLREAIAALSLDQAPAFNAEVVDAEGVLYQSWAGVSRPFGAADGEHDALLAELCALDDGTDGLAGFAAHDWMALPLIPLSDVVGLRADDDEEVLVPNDGLAAVDSARWGEFRGCLPADHMEQLGQKNLPRANVRNGFDVARFYANVAGDLAARGL
jgi:triacylglycerol lipase